MRSRTQVAGLLLAGVVALAGFAAQAQSLADPAQHPRGRPEELAPAAPALVLPEQPEVVVDIERQLRAEQTTPPAPIGQPAARTAAVSQPSRSELPQSSAIERAPLPPPASVIENAPLASPTAVIETAPLSVPTTSAIERAPLPPPPAIAVEKAPQPASPATTVEKAPQPAEGLSGDLNDALTAEVLKAAAEAFVSQEPPRQSAAEPAARKEREAVVGFYAQRNFNPLWIVEGHWTATAQSAIARIALAADDGLDMTGYAIAAEPPASAAGRALAELQLSEAIAAYGRQASGGRLDPARLSNLIGAKPDVADAGRMLTTVAGAADAGAALQAFNPPQPAYALLREKLQQLRRNQKPLVHSPIPAGPILRVGMRDPRVMLVRARFGLDPNSERSNDLTYDTKVAAAVADFQRANGLPPSGILTARTVTALSGGESSRVEAEVVANMERWRWLPRDLGANYVQVNIPDYSLQVVHSGTVVHEARVVVGKPDSPTPIFSHNMEFIIVNPYWNVPYSIIKKEMLPKLASDPDYFARHGYEVVQRGDMLIVRQPPGEDNALGRIKFMFPNSYSVYLHDTPSRSLFADDRRAFSHGCIRVDQPFKLAEIVLGRDNGWSEDKVKRLIGRGERSINLPHPLPVHIVYFTAFVDSFGKLQLRDDIYGYSQRVRAALGLKG
jgi:L,D-transpeptidase YcbB